MKSFPKKSFKKSSKPKAQPSKKLKKVIDQEITKHSDVKELSTYASAASTTSGTVVVLNSIAEGDEYNQRTGRKIVTKDIDIMYRYYSAAANGPGSGQVCLVYDRQPDGATPSYGTIFDTNNSLNAGLVFRNTIGYAERFKIYKFDQLPESRGSADPTNGWLDRVRHFVVPKDEHRVTRYGLSTASTPNTGAWYFTYADTANSTTNATINYGIKYRYTDN